MESASFIMLRRPDRTHDERYISKNNGNIARLDLIHHMFPDANIQVPVRHPLEHAASLFRQHRHFTKMHNDKTFTRRYMADLGHYEFGGLHRPIAFPGAHKLLCNRHPSEIDYWIAAFEHVLARRDKIILSSYEALCADGQHGLAEITAQLGIPHEGMLDTIAAIVRPPSPPRSDKMAFDPRFA